MQNYRVFKKGCLAVCECDDQKKTNAGRNLIIAENVIFAHIEFGNQ